MIYIKFIFILAIVCHIKAESKHHQCGFKDESFEYQKIHIFNCSGVNVVAIKDVDTNRTMIQIESNMRRTELHLKSLPKISTDIVHAETYEVYLIGIQLGKEMTYVEVLTKLGVSVDQIYLLSVNGCMNFTMKQLDGMHNVWMLELSNIEHKIIGLGYFFPNLRTLRFISNSFNELPSLKNLSFLEEIMFESNNMKMIPSSYFKDLYQLKVININEPELTDIPRGVFHDLQELDSLTIISNLSYFPTPINLHELRELTLEMSPTIPKDIPDFWLKPMKNLRTLSITDSGVQKIHRDAFMNNTKLIKVDLSSNELLEVPPGLFKYNRMVEELDLCENNFTSLQDSALPPNLRILHAQNTNLDSLNISSRMIRLQTLDLSYSRMTGNITLNRNFSSQYPNIRKMVFTGNLLSSVVLSTSLRFFDDLELDLSNNRIENITLFMEIPAHPKTLQKIYLNLEGNPLKCDCHLKQFLKYLMIQKEKRIIDIRIMKDVKCAWPPNKTLLTIALDEIKCSDELKM